MEKKLIRKEFRLDKKHIDIIHELMTEKNLTSEKDVIIFLINYYLEKEKSSKEIIDTLKEELTRIRLGVRTAEHNSIIIKDLFNTLLMNNDDWVHAAMFSDMESMKHPIVDECEKHLSTKIAVAKMYKDTKR